MHGSSNESISRLFYDFKTDVVKEITILQEQGKEIIKHQKHTNGRVTKNEEELEKIDKHLQGLVSKSEIKKVQKNIYKVMLVGFLVGSLIWIKESRDTILSILFRIL